MSKSQNRSETLSVFARKKRRGEKLVVLTAYDLTSAHIVREGGLYVGCG